MNTTADMNAAFADEMKKELGIYVRRAKSLYDKTLAKMVADLQTNPVTAIVWSAETIVKEQTYVEMWLWIERSMAENNPREVLAKAAAEVQYRIRSFFGSNSTSMFSNAVDRAKAESYVRLAEELDGLLRHYGIEKNM